ncbi:D-alanyl-D-alanine carboxypeptidase family protein [Oxalobacteraceae bacterium OTU3CAMAD1]|nr:D-alanyl-D-alanine carboxypeptidase family protein [Oxalobacteraceae bacterium OTU3CAMAD1]
MTTTIIRPHVLHTVATRRTDQSDTEPSGAQWAQRFKGSKDTKDLACTFRKAVDAFVEAMTKAGIQVRISSTYRPLKRSYLMHWCWQIKYKYVQPEDVPPMAGVDINWVHPTPAASLEAAKQMVQAFDMNALNTAPALRSLHNEGQAIDMSISWRGTVSVKDGSGKLIEVKTLPRSGMNSQLKAIGASYGVKKFVGGAKDKPHWSINGR